MIQRQENPPQMLVEMLVHLGRLAHGDATTTDLTSVQWTVLRYMKVANRFSRTPSAFAKFHGTTRGTASQSIKGLVAQGYLTQVRSASDGRSTRLDLTDKATEILSKDPFEALARAVDALPRGVRDQFANTLQRILCAVAREKGENPFGTCQSCLHLQRRARFVCTFTDEVLKADEVGQFCINYVQGKNELSVM
jgi:DNA-binding MarR family transcriptional regulator